MGTRFESLSCVRYPYAALQTIPSRLDRILEQTNSALAQLEGKMHKFQGKLSDQTLVTLLHARLTYLNDTISLASDTYIGLNGPSRAKRGLIDGIGKLSRMLFGTAMDEDVEQLRERYNHLTSIASANYRAIHINCRNIASLDKHVSDLALYCYVGRGENTGEVSRKEAVPPSPAGGGASLNSPLGSGSTVLHQGVT